MNPFQRLGVKISNWWRGEPQNDGGKMTLNSPSFLERIGLKRKGKPTSEVTYFTCLKMLSETLAKMPIKYYQKTDKGIIEAEATDTSKLLSKRPNPFMTPTTFWNTVEINRNHYGNGYVYMRKKFDRKKFGGEIKIVDLWVMQSTTLFRSNPIPSESDSSDCSETTVLRIFAFMIADISLQVRLPC